MEYPSSAFDKYSASYPPAPEVRARSWIPEILQNGLEKSKKNLESYEKKRVQYETQCYAEDITRYAVQLTDPKLAVDRAKDKNSEHVRKLVLEILEANKEMFDVHVASLDVNEDNVSDVIYTLSEEALQGDEGSVSWGRILTLFAFGAKMAARCHSEGLEGQVIGKYLGKHVADITTDWIMTQGGWNALPKAFPAKDTGINYKKFLLATAGTVLGLTGLTAAVIASRA